MAFGESDDIALSSDEEEQHVPYLFPKDDCETWHDYHSGALSSFWLSCQEFLSANGLPVLDKCTYVDFVRFCHRHSSGRVVLFDLDESKDCRVVDGTR